MQEVNGKNGTMSSPSVHLDLGPDFLQAVLEQAGVSGWNRWVGAMVDANLVCPVWEEPRDEPMLILWLSLEEADLRGLQAPGINLEWCSLGQTRLDNADVRAAGLGCVARSSFRDADLTDAVISYGDISGADFTGAKLNGLYLQCCHYERGIPPVGLPDFLLRQSQAIPPEPPETSTPATGRPIKVQGRLITT